MFGKYIGLRKCSEVLDRLSLFESFLTTCLTCVKCSRVDLAAEINEEWALEVELVVSEGETGDVVLKVIEEDPTIRILVLGAASGNEGPGPLVSQLVGKISGGMRVPITVVPGNLTDSQIDELT